MRPGDPPTLDNAREYLESSCLISGVMIWQRVGRYKLNQRLNLDDIVPLRAPHDHQVRPGASWSSA